MRLKYEQGNVNLAILRSLGCEKCREMDKSKITKICIMQKKSPLKTSLGFQTYFKRKQHIETQPLLSRHAFIKQEIIEISLHFFKRQGEEIEVPFSFETYTFNRIHNVKYGKMEKLCLLHP